MFKALKGWWERRTFIGSIGLIRIDMGKGDEILIGIDDVLKVLDESTDDNLLNDILNIPFIDCRISTVSILRREPQQTAKNALSTLGDLPACRITEILNKIEASGLLKRERKNGNSPKATHP